MKAITCAVALGTAALLLAPAVSYGQQGGSTTAFVVGRDGNPIIAARTGECVRTRFWTPAASHPRCKPAVTPAAAPSRQMKR